MDVRPTLVDPLPAGTEQAFFRVQARFVDGLPARWAAIHAAHDTAQRQALLHRLKGAAGSFGFAALSGAAHRAEEAALHADPAALGAALHDISTEIDVLTRGDGASNP
ncbi:Hpt domain-containing protein [Variovorax sp. LT2P21]|uniref:Hpt domain-containing protein n=1 Tax=Variovorax sp. LT2P21 TaxID=3443731 RepID=UPI003F497A94